MKAAEDPKRITSAKINLFLPSSLYGELRAIADEADRPVSREARAAIREYVERRRARATSN